MSPVVTFEKPAGQLADECRREAAALYAQANDLIELAERLEPVRNTTRHATLPTNPNPRRDR